jgi:hypothetical protein
MCTMSGHESQVFGILSLHEMQSKEATLPVSCRGRAGLCIGAVSLNSDLESGHVAEQFVQVPTPFRRAVIGKE